MTIYIIIILLKLLLNILPNKYEVLIIKRLIRSGKGDINNYKQINYITLKRALFKAIIY
jgi:hypothetical protein